LVRLTQQDRSPAVCCGRGEDATLLACRPALVDPAALASARVSLPGGLSLGLANGVPAGRSDRVGYHFTNPAAGAEAVFTYSPTTGKQKNFKISAVKFSISCFFAYFCKESFLSQQDSLIPDTAKTQYRKFETNIPRKGTVWQ
jgi:hypothetical protein